MWISQLGPATATSTVPAGWDYVIVSGGAGFPLTTFTGATSTRCPFFAPCAPYRRRVGADLRPAGRARSLWPARRQLDGPERRRWATPLFSSSWASFFAGVDNYAHAGASRRLPREHVLDPLKTERMDHSCRDGLLFATALSLLWSVLSAYHSDVRALPLTFPRGDARAADAKRACKGSSGRRSRIRNDAQTRRAHHRRRRRDRARPDRASRRPRRPRHRHARRHPARPAIARKVDREFTGSILDRGVLERILAEFEVELDLSPGGAALDARRVHARARAQGQRRGHAQPARVRAERGGVARPAGRVHLSVLDRRLRPARSRHQDARRQGEGGRVRTPTTMYGCNKLYCEQLGRYYAQHYKQLAAERASGRVDFRSVRFPGLISAVTMPVGRDVRLRARDDPRGGQESRMRASSGPTRGFRSWPCPTASRRC